MITVTIKNNSVYVQSPYESKFVKQAKQINGKWSAPYWVFPAENENLVRNLCREVYGTDGTVEPTTTILVTLSEVGRHEDDRLMVGPIEVLRKWNRDSAPKLGENCTVVQGKLLSSGGSRNNPRITYTDDCVIRVKNVPQSVAESLITDSAYRIDESVISEKISLTNDEKTVVEFLKNLPKERLTAILQEIN